jgi:hypothetical protein
VDRIEIITEFRRMELIGEDHVGVDASFGRAGIADAEKALNPWRNRLTLAAHLRFAFPVQSSLYALPPINIRLEDETAIAPVATDRNLVKGSGGVPISGTVTAVFAVDAMPAHPTTVVIEMNDHTLGRVRIDLRGVE